MPSVEPATPDRTDGDVFISYAREDREVALELHGLLQTGGVRVWWDERLPPGSPFHLDIPRALSAAKVVLVLWSQHSIVSPWVLDEASRARDARKLVPVRIERVELPLGFGALNTVDLMLPWGAQARQRLTELVESVCASVAGPQRPPGPGTPSPRRRRRLAGASLAASAMVALAAVFVAKCSPPAAECHSSSEHLVDLTSKAMDTASAGNYEAALLRFDHVLSNDAAFQPALLWRAHCYLNTGEPERARADLERVLAPPCCYARECEKARALLTSLRASTRPQRDANHVPVDAQAASRPDAGRPSPAHEALVPQIFGDDREQRIAATTTLIVELPGDPQIVPAVVTAALAQPSNKSGVINTLVILQNASSEAIRGNRVQINRLIASVRGNGPMTEDRIAKITQKFSWELRRNSASTEDDVLLPEPKP